MTVYKLIKLKKTREFMNKLGKRAF